MRRPDGGAHCPAGHRRGVDAAVHGAGDAADLDDVRRRTDPQGVEQPTGDGAGRDQACGEPAGGVAAAAQVGVAAAPGVVDPVRVARARHVRQVAVGGAVDVAVADPQRQGDARGAAAKQAAEGLDAVGLAAGAHQRRGAGPPGVEGALHPHQGDGQAGGHAVEQDADADAVRFAEQADAQATAEAVQVLTVRLPCRVVRRAPRPARSSWKPG